MNKTWLVRWAALLLAGGAVPALASAAPMAEPEGPVQTDLPCGVTYDRSVTPQEVLVNTNVHVHVEVNGACQSELKGVDIFFVVDRSVTMFSEDLIDATQDALKNFVNAMTFPPSNAGLITFASSPQVNVPLTNDRMKLLNGIDRIRLAEEADVRALPNAFRDATELIDRDGTPGNEKIVLVITAGPDQNGALVNMPTVTQAARNAGVKVIFLMFPDARYLHYVEASSDCTGAYCGMWTSRAGNLSKWAWGVDKNTIDGQMRTLITLLVRSLDITMVEIEEYVTSGAEAVPSSVQPPPSNFAGGPPYRDMVWEFAAIPSGGIVIDYDATMIFEDETYPEAILAELVVTYNDGLPGRRVPLPNPDITVRSVLAPTATPTGPSVTETPTGSPSPTAPPATDTPTGPPDGFILYLPLTLKTHEM